MTVSEAAAIFAIEMIRKSGVREWSDSEVRQQIAIAAAELAAALAGEEAMATSKTLVAEMDGTPKSIVFADHAGDFSPTAANDLRDATSGNRTTCQLSLASVATAAARQSAKVDLGAARALLYGVRAALEWAATPTAGHVASLYWANSQSSTAANGNPGNISGSDAAYAGYSSNLAASLPQLQFIGDFVMTAQATGTIQVGSVGAFMPRERYGSLVVVNHLAGSGAAFHSDDVEMHVVFDPIVPQGQAA